MRNEPLQRKEHDEMLSAAYQFRESLLPRADEHAHGQYPLWHGWAIVEAFEAGWKFAREQQSKKEPTDA